ncbi:hypothetical protein GCM10010372_82550 [Streptomyces tauricus]|uniref:hypothetical protein n=1 Tax=Streptomyces tauricus TaxID=68274 RepID=UPI0016786667|nr:hypothetical protein [Streptomyces tauricus]GHA70956.1 hypothetical protein GCM10010372_82550 [Streptomyces tauricus]
MTDHPPCVTVPATAEGAVAGFPPQAPPVHRRQTIPAHPTVSPDRLTARRIQMLHGADPHAPAAHQLPSYAQARLSAR